MPRMDGFGFVHAFKPFAEEKTQNCNAIVPPIIFCTIEHSLPKIQAALEVGASEYIMKPFNEDIVREKLITIGLLPSE